MSKLASALSRLNPLCPKKHTKEKACAALLAEREVVIAEREAANKRLVEIDKEIFISHHFNPVLAAEIVRLMDDDAMLERRFVVDGVLSEKRDTVSCIGDLMAAISTIDCAATVKGLNQKTVSCMAIGGLAVLSNPEVVRDA